MPDWSFDHQEVFLCPTARSACELETPFRKRKRRAGAIERIDVGKDLAEGYM
jgi:hypothetical protein